MHEKNGLICDLFLYAIYTVENLNDLVLGKICLIGGLFLYPTFLYPVSSVQPADIGLPTGNGKKLSCSQAQLDQAACLAVA